MGQSHAFCVVCGASLTSPASTGPEATQLLRTAPPSPSGWEQPYGQWADPATTPTRPPSPPRRNRRVAIVAITTTVVVLLAAATILILRQRHSDQAENPVPVPSPSDSSSAGSTSSTEASSSPASGLGTVVTITSGGDPGTSQSSTAPSVISVDPTTSAPPATSSRPPGDASNPLGGVRADIPCGSVFVVQVASETDQPAFTRRVAQILSAGQLPSRARYARTATSCPGLFNADANYFVLYAGPFTSVADACPTRLLSPDDAFVKSTDPAQKSEAFSCLCPAAVASLPTVGGVGTHGPWVGELQRLLRAKLKYRIDDLDQPGGTPTGTFSAGTATAVTQFQTDHGLPGTGTVDAGTWQQLQSAGC